MVNFTRVALAALALVPLSSAQCLSTPFSPFEDTVTFYTHVNYAGPSCTIEADSGCVNLGTYNQQIAGQVSSVKISNNIRCFVYDTPGCFSGEQVLDAPGSANLIPMAINDRIQSARCIDWY